MWRRAGSPDRRYQATSTTTTNGLEHSEPSPADETNDRDLVRLLGAGIRRASPIDALYKLRAGKNGYVARATKTSASVAVLKSCTR